jgi:hypothetical protein
LKKKERDPLPGPDATIEEEADFWDTHSTSDYRDMFKPVEVKFAKNLSSSLSIRLSPETTDKLFQKAHEIGVGPTTLARMWIMEKLKSESA